MSKLRDRVRELVDFLRFLDFTFPESQYNNVLVSRNRMTVNLYQISWGMLELVQKRTPERVSVEPQPTDSTRKFYNVKVLIPLEQLSGELCAWLAVRRCWGLVCLQHWISELELFQKE